MVELGTHELERVCAARIPDQELSRQHHKVELALLFDTGVLDGLTEPAKKTALLMAFHTRMGGASVHPGPNQARRRWGLGAYLPKDDAGGTEQWMVLYQELIDRQLVEITNPDWYGKHPHPRFTILLAPVLSQGRFLSNHTPRTVPNLRRLKVPTVALPSGYDARIGRRNADDIRLLFALHALSHAQAWMGVDPNHVRVVDRQLVVSEALCRTLHVTEQDLLARLMEWQQSGILDFVPSSFNSLNMYPSAETHWYVKGDALNQQNNFRVRMRHSVRVGE